MFKYMHKICLNKQLKFFVFLFFGFCFNFILNQPAMAAFVEESPVTVVWLLIERDNAVHRINNEFSSLTGPDLALAQELEKTLKQQGLALVYPLMDLSEMKDISEVVLQNETIEPLQENAKRYNASQVLIGRITPSAQGWKGHWAFIKEGKKHTWDILKPETNLLFLELANQLKNVVSQSASATGILTEKTQFNLIVLDIASSEDYEKVVAFLQQLPNVVGVEASQIMPEKVVFSIEAKVSQDTIAKLISEAQFLMIAEELPENNSLQETSSIQVPASTSASGSASTSEKPALTYKMINTMTNTEVSL